jgi:hypothetical protein
MNSTRKTALVLVTLLIISTIGTKAQYITFGVFGNPQISWFSSDTQAYSSDGAVFGFNGGFTLERYFADRYAITTGVSISNMGGKIIFNNPNDTISTLDGLYTIEPGTSVSLKGQYISVPLGLKFKTNEIGYTTFYANLGVNANIRLKGYSLIESISLNREVLNKNHMHFGYISYFFETGVQYSLGGPSAVLAGLTFSNGLTHPLKNNLNVINVFNLGLKVGLVF